MSSVSVTHLTPHARSPASKAVILSSRKYRIDVLTGPRQQPLDDPFDSEEHHESAGEVERDVTSVRGKSRLPPGPHLPREVDVVPLRRNGARDGHQRRPPEPRL